jgi:hypothetical protein
MGASADTGLTSAGITFNAGSIRNLQTNSIISNSGDYITPNADISTLNNSGDYTQTATANIETRHTRNRFYNFTVDAGVTLTCNSGFEKLADEDSNNMTINGTIVIPAGTSCQIGISAAGTMTIGANGDFSGDGNLEFLAEEGTFTNNRATAFSVTGLVRIAGNAADNLVVPAWDFSDANVQVRGATGAGSTRHIIADTVYAGGLNSLAFSLVDGGGGAFTVDNTDNADLVIGGVVTFASNATWLKGTGTITINGDSGTQAIDFAGETLEDIVLNAPGLIKQWTGDCTVVNFTHTAGVLTDSGGTITGSGAFTTGASGSIATSNANGIINAAGLLTGFASYTWADGYIIANIGTNTWDGTNFPNSSNINYQLGVGNSTTFSAVYSVKTMLVADGNINHGGQNFTTAGNYTISSGATNTDSGLDGMTLTVGGAYSVIGQVGTPLDLGAGAGWTLTVTGIARAKYVTVKNSDASGGSQVIAQDSIDEGSNLNWSFVSSGVAGYYNPGIKVTRKNTVLIA